MHRHTTLADRERALRNGTRRNFRETWPHADSAATTLTLTSGTQLGAIIALLRGETFTNALINVGATGATWGSNTDGHWHIDVYDSNGKLVTQTADQGAAGLVGFTSYAPALITPITPAFDAIYNIVVMCYLGTGGSPVAPIIRALAPFQTGKLLIGMPQETISANAGQTTGVAPATLGSTGTTVQKAWMALYS